MWGKGNKRTNWVFRYICTCILSSPVTRFSAKVGTVLPLRYVLSPDSVSTPTFTSQPRFRYSALHANTACLSSFYGSLDKPSQGPQGSGFSHSADNSPALAMPRFHVGSVQPKTYWLPVWGPQTQGACFPLPRDSIHCQMSCFSKTAAKMLRSLSLTQRPRC